MSVIFIISASSPRQFHFPGIPHVDFPPYTREEVLEIITREPRPIGRETTAGESDSSKQLKGTDDALLWKKFCLVVWDSLGKSAARDVRSFSQACRKLWKPFVQPVLDGQFHQTEFTRLMISRRHLFQNDEALVAHIVLKHRTVNTTGTEAQSSDTNSKALPIYNGQRAIADAGLATVNYDIPYYAKYLLISAYLASFNTAATDPTFFMKAHEKRRRRRKNMPSKSTSKHRKIARNLLAPSPFSLERLLAILHALLPNRLAQGSDIFAQIATLVSLRLLLRTGAASTHDAIDVSTKWRVNVGLEAVSVLGRSIGLEVRDYLALNAQH